MSKEIWKEVPGYPDYCVSNLGNVVSLKSGKPMKIGYTRVTKEGKRIAMVTFRKGRNDVRQMLVHTLVMKVFGGKYVDGTTEEITHLNGNTLDNRICNLKIVSKLRYQAIFRYHEAGKALIAECEKMDVEFGEFSDFLCDKAEEVVAMYLVDKKLTAEVLDEK